MNHPAYKYAGAVSILLLIIAFLVVWLAPDGFKSIAVITAYLSGTTAVDADNMRREAKNNDPHQDR